MREGGALEVDRAIAVWSGVVAAAGCIIVTALWWHVPQVTVWQWLQASGVLLASTVAVTLPQRPPAWLVGGAYVASTASVSVAAWITNAQLADASVPFQTFAAFKVVLLGAACTFPTRLRFSAPVIAGVALLPSLEWLTWPPSWRAHAAVTEPVATLLVGAISIGFLVFRARSLAAHERAARSEAELATMEQVAQVALAVRDLANSPLQTLEASLSLLQAGASDPAKLTAQMDRALARLRELNERLLPYEAHLRWDREGFDPIAVLERARRP